MASDAIFTIKRLQNLEKIFIPFSKATRLPFAECDPETFDDQIYIYESQSEGMEAVKKLNEDKFPSELCAVEKKAVGSVYMNLFIMGVNAIVFVSKGKKNVLQLDQIVKNPGLKNEVGKAPVINASLQLTTIYMMQEIRRPDMDKNDQERNQKIMELDQEMKANLQKSLFIMPLTQSEEKDEDGKPKVQVQLVQTKEGKAFQPIFSEMWECSKYVRARKFAVNPQLAILNYDGLKASLVDSASGYVLNMESTNISLMKGRF